MKTTTGKFFGFGMIVSQQHRDSPSLAKEATSPAREEEASHPNAHQGKTGSVCGRQKWDEGVCGGEWDEGVCGWEEWGEGVFSWEEWNELQTSASDADLLLASYMFSTISHVYKYWETQTASCQFIGVTRVNRVNVLSLSVIPQVFIISWV